MQIAEAWEQEEKFQEQKRKREEREEEQEYQARRQRRQTAIAQQVDIDQAHAARRALIQLRRDEAKVRRERLRAEAVANAQPPVNVPPLDNETEAQSSLQESEAEAVAREPSREIPLISPRLIHDPGGGSENEQEGGR